MYENAQYQKDREGNVVCIMFNRDGATYFCPLDPANTDYQNIMQLVENGELTIQPAEEVQNG